MFHDNEIIDYQIKTKVGNRLYVRADAGIKSNREPYHTVRWRSDVLHRSWLLIRAGRSRVAYEGGPPLGCWPSRGRFSRRTATAIPRGPNAYIRRRFIGPSMSHLLGPTLIRCANWRAGGWRVKWGSNWGQRGGWCPVPLRLVVLLMAQRTYKSYLK